MVTALYLLSALLLIGLNGFFVLAEFSILKVRPSRIEELVADEHPNALVLQEVQAAYSDYALVCQAGITLASIGLGFIGEPAVARLVQPALSLLGSRSEALRHTVAIVVAYCVVSYLHILIGELAPKSISIQWTDRAALATVRPLRLFHRLLGLPLFVVNRSALWLLSVVGLSLKLPEEKHSEEELRIILGQSQTGGLMPFRRLLLMENVLDLSDLQVRDAMRPRALVKGLYSGAPWEENFRILRESRFSRLPLMREDLDRPFGIIHVKDLLYAGPAMGQMELERIARPYHVTREETPLENLLAELQRRRMHLAIVLDKEDRWTGLVTMEDVIEEIVGTVEDEFELEPPIFLADALTVGRVVLGVEAQSIEEAIRGALARIPGSDLPFSSDAVLKMIRERTRMAVSFLGEGLCVSHARTDGIERPILIFARSETGVPVKGVAEKAQLIFVLLTPTHQARAQARLLSRIGGLLESEYVEERLRDASTPEQVLEAIRAGEAAALG